MEHHSLKYFTMYVHNVKHIIHEVQKEDCNMHPHNHIKLKLHTHIHILIIVIYNNFSYIPLHSVLLSVMGMIVFGCIYIMKGIY